MTRQSPSASVVNRIPRSDPDRRGHTVSDMSVVDRSSRVMHEGLRLASVAAARTQMATRPLRARADRRRSPLEPVAVVIDPLETPDRLRESGLSQLYVGSVGRFATCTGVAWIDDLHVVTAYLLTGSVAVYRTPPGPTASPRVPTELVWSERGVFGGATPTMLAIDPTRSWVAMPMSASRATPAQVIVAAVDRSTGHVDLDRATVVPSPGDRNLHAAEFAADGRSLIWSSIDQAADGLRTVPLIAVDDPTAPPRAGEMSVIPSGRSLAAVKGLAIAPSGRFMAIAHGANASFARRRAPVGRLETRTWTGESLGPVVSTVTAGLMCPEDVAFHPRGDQMAVVDQMSGRVHLLAVDPESGVIDPRARAVISWANGGFTAPHACSFSPDGRWLAVTDYGDASLRFFDVADL